MPLLFRKHVVGSASEEAPREVPFLALRPSTPVLLPEESHPGWVFSPIHYFLKDVHLHRSPPAGLSVPIAARWSRAALAFPRPLLTPHGPTRRSADISLLLVRVGFFHCVHVLAPCSASPP